MIFANKLFIWSPRHHLCNTLGSHFFFIVHCCHGPAGVPRLATRCLCVLSTWLVVCLVPCAPMSIVCPLPSCYLIIVSVAPAVSPSLPSFVSLYSLLVSAVLCWSVVFHVSSSCEFRVDCAPVFCLPACLFFPFGVVFVVHLFNFIIKTLIFLCIWVLDLISPDRTDQPRWGLSRGGVWVAHHPTLSPAPYTNASSSTRPWAPAVSRAMTWGVLPWSSVVQLRG